MADKTQNPAMSTHPQVSSGQGGHAPEGRVFSPTSLLWRAGVVMLLPGALELQNSGCWPLVFSYSMEVISPPGNLVLFLVASLHNIKFKVMD